MRIGAIGILLYYIFFDACECLTTTPVPPKCAVTKHLIFLSTGLHVTNRRLIKEQTNIFPKFNQARRNKFSVGTASLISMKAERAGRLTAWGPEAHLRAPGGVQGHSPDEGPGGSAPEAFGFGHLQKVQKGSPGNFFFALNQPTSGTEMFQSNDTAHCSYSGNCTQPKIEHVFSTFPKL